MSNRYNNGSHYENHARAAEMHDLAAHAHLVAAQGKQDHLTGREHSRQALEHSQRAHQHTQDTWGEPGVQILSFRETTALAYDLWVARGRPEGSPEIDWFSAEDELRSR